MKNSVRKKVRSKPSSVSGIKIAQTNLTLKEINPLTASQQNVFNCYYQGKNVLLHGLAGTGKTFLSLYLGLESVLQRDSLQSNVVIVRSVVPTRDIGFLPGDQNDKTKIYEAPYKGICSELFGRDDSYEILRHHKIVNFLTTSFIRGITINNAVIVIDEMQNLTGHELDSVFTRLGENCRLMICGDYTQSDFTKSSEKVGLHKFISVVEKLDSFESVVFGEQDIVRSDIVREYIIQKNKLNVVF